MLCRQRWTKRKVTGKVAKWGGGATGVDKENGTRYVYFIDNNANDAHI